MSPSYTDYLKKFDELNFGTLNYETLLKVHNRIKNIRAQYDEASKKFKEREEAIKDTIKARMTKAKIDSLKTPAGRLAITSKDVVTLYDAEMFYAWLMENPKFIPDVLSKKPFTQAKIKEFDDNGELPPGLKWYREPNLSITKS